MFPPWNAGMNAHHPFREGQEMLISQILISSPQLPFVIYKYRIDQRNWRKKEKKTIFCKHTNQLKWNNTKGSIWVPLEGMLRAGVLREGACGADGPFALGEWMGAEGPILWVHWGRPRKLRGNDSMNVNYPLCLSVGYLYFFIPFLSFSSADLEVFIVILKCLVPYDS